ncbi:MAG: bifunctional folylpolyglutamate synthase/dihydrofolate synthase [Acidobacteria bacterium]|nr:bifunctional folylpolyglutamate synthase/dihydrofolate synthase [Acidobacteriota bacterium]
MTLSYEDSVQRLLWLGYEGRSLKWDLRNIQAVLERLGHPEQRFRSVHIAGTNGKGSVAALVESILRAAGSRTGLYTSPHLARINERIAVGGCALTDEEFAAAFDAVTGAIESLLGENALPNHPSYFETLTAMGFWHFAQAGVELAVVEVGLGGRLDATNILTPEVAVVTAIDFDHERYLGHSIERIAAEKAGIIKPGVPVVSAAVHPVARQVVAARATALGAPLMDVVRDYRAEQVRAQDFGRYEFVLSGPQGLELRLAPGLRGAFQVDNAMTAAVVAQQLAARGWAIPRAAIIEGTAGARWAGRMELVERRPLLFLDGAHNPAGARQVARFWEEHLPGRRIHLVYGTVRDKAVEEVAELLFPRAAQVIVTRPATPRAASPDALEGLARTFNSNVALEPDPARAVSRALEAAGPEEVVFVTGSLFLVGDCRQALVSGRGMAAATEPAALAAPTSPAGF